jgi:uncharacterized membrane protein
MKKSPLIGISLRNGSIAGILAGALLIILYFIGPHPMLILPYADFRILLFGIFIFFTLKEFRNNHQEGVLYFVQGMVGSLIFVTVAATVGAMVVLIYSKINPEFVSDFIEQALESARTFSENTTLSEVEKNRIRVMMEGLPATNGKSLAGQHFVQSLMIGLFVSIILSVILRKQPKP